MADDPVALLSNALEQAAEVIDGVDADQAALPTPCRSWDVRALAEHLVDDLGKFAVAAAGDRPDWSKPAPAVDGDLAAAFRERMAPLLDGWRGAGDLTATIKLPLGEVPASFVVYQQVAELAAHAWDLAKATGQKVDFDPAVATAALDWAATALRPQFRGDEDSGKVFGPEVAVSADAPAYDRLAAFFGRNPRDWS